MKIRIDDDEKFPFYSAKKTSDDAESVSGWYVVEISEEEWGELQEMERITHLLQDKLADLEKVGYEEYERKRKRKKNEK